MQQFKVTDVRNAANQFGQDVLGRNLSGAEFDQVRTFLKSLQTQRRDDVLGVDDTSWYREGMDPAVGFDSTDIEAAVNKVGNDDIESYAGGQGIQALNGFFDVKTPMAPK